MMTKILVIDDTPDLLEDITELLVILNYEVISANNGLTGLNLAKHELPDLILCDIMMPELNGYEVFNLLQSGADTATIPFIFLSAKAERSSVRFGMNLGADDYITKPFEIDELKSAISARLNKKAIYKEVEKKLQESENVFRKLAQKEELINLLTKQIRNSLELKNILNTTVESIRNLLQIHRCSFYWYRTDVERAYFELIDEAIAPEMENLCSHNSLTIAAGLGQIILSKYLIKIDDVNKDKLLDEESKKNLISAKIQALLGILIQNNTGKTGVIICEQLNQAREWNEQEIQLLQAVGDQLAIAIEQGELYAKSGFTATTAKIQAMQLEKTLSELKQTQLQLIQTEKMSSLGQLVAGVAHEINNPVNFIYGNVNYIKEYVESLIKLVQFYQTKNPELNTEIEEELGDVDIDFILYDLPKILNSMEIGADRIKQIVLSLKNFSRHDQSEMKSVNIHEGLDNTLLILASRLKPKGAIPEIEIVKKYGDLPLVDCYAGQLNQVFMNIIVNAIDAIEDYHIKRSKEQININANQIIIETKKIDTTEIHIGIMDNGPGMIETTRQRIFDPFFTTKPVGKGTGLGMSISYQIIVEKHSGKIECISEPGKGTTFKVTIPLKQQEKS